MSHEGLSGEGNQRVATKGDKYGKKSTLALDGFSLEW